MLPRPRPSSAGAGRSRLRSRSLRLGTRTCGQGLPWTRPRPRRGWLPPGCRFRPDGGSATRRRPWLPPRRSACRWWSKALGIGAQIGTGRGARSTLPTRNVSGRQRQALGTLGKASMSSAWSDGAVAELIVGITRDPLFGPVLTIGTRRRFGRVARATAPRCCCLPTRGPLRQRLPG